MQLDPAQLADEIERDPSRLKSLLFSKRALIVRALRLMAEPALAEADDAARLKEAARGALAAIHAAILSRPSMQPDTPESLRALADRLDDYTFVSPHGNEHRAFGPQSDALRRAADRIDQFDAAIAQRDEARHVVSETLWMAGRYANGRQTYAVKMYNDALLIAEAGGYASKAEPAVDGREMGAPMRIDPDEALARVEALAAARRAAAADRG